MKFLGNSGEIYVNGEKLLNLSNWTFEVSCNAVGSTSVNPLYTWTNCILSKKSFRITALCNTDSTINNVPYNYIGDDNVRIFLKLYFESSGISISAWSYLLNITNSVIYNNVVTHTLEFIGIPGPNGEGPIVA